MSEAIEYRENQDGKYWWCETHKRRATFVGPPDGKPRCDPKLAGILLPCQCSAEHIDIVFDAPPGPEGGRFVEVEDAEGRSIRVGEWIERDDGYWALRISPETWWSG